MMKTLIKWQEENLYIFLKIKFKSSTGAEGVIRSPCFWLLTRQPVRIHDLQFSVDFSLVSDNAVFPDRKMNSIDEYNRGIWLIKGDSATPRSEAGFCPSHPK